MQKLGNLGQYICASFYQNQTAFAIEQTVSTYDQVTLLTKIGSVFTSTAFVYSLINKLFVMVAEDVTIHNKSYTFKPKKLSGNV